MLVLPVLEPKLLNESKWHNARNQTATKDGNNILDYIQGYPQRMRLQRRLYRLGLDHFLTFRLPCRPKLDYLCAYSPINY